MQKKRHLLSLLLFPAIIWAGSLYLVSYLANGGIRDGPFMGMDLAPAVGVIVALAALVTIAWYFMWRKYKKTQRALSVAATASDLARPHSLFDPLLPILFDGNTVRINRGFSAQSIDVADIEWIHINGRMVSFHLANSRAASALFNGANMPGVNAVVRELSQARPDILLSNGRYSASYRQCKRAYRERVRSV